MTSQNIDLSFWETQYKWPRALIHKSVIAGGGGMQSPWASESKQQQQQNEYLNLKNWFYALNFFFLNCGSNRKEIQ